MKRDTETELTSQAIKCLWTTHQYEEAIAITKRLLKLKPRYPLYYLILSDCNAAIFRRDNDIKASGKSKTYWEKACAPDSKFIHSDYFQQGIDATASYLLATQDLGKLTESKMKQPQQTKQTTSTELYDAMFEQTSVSKDPDVRLAYFRWALMQAKSGKNQILHAFDSDGKSVKPTLDEFYKAKRKDPKRQLYFVVSIKDPIAGEETQYKFNLLKHLKFDFPSDSVIKARQRRSRYYYAHQEERQKHQKLYDSDNRQRKRVRNKLDYSWRKSGLTKKYDTSDKSSEE